jgi:hypothetical protein
MRRLGAGFRSRYGAHPAHLLLVLASFALAGYASVQLLATRTIHVGVWFIGSAVGHDAILLPIYALADVALVRLWRVAPGPRGAAWLNHVRFPGAIALVLLLVYAPEITRRHTAQQSNSRLSTQPYLSHWLAVVAILFVVSALWYAVRLVLVRRRRPRPVPVRAA